MSESLLTLDARRVEDREIFAGIVRRYQNLVTALTFSMTGNLQQSEDLAQDTFVAAWRSLTGGESRPDVAAEKMGPWLCGIARNLTNNWLRRTTRERQTPHISVGDDAVSGMHAATDLPDDESAITRETQATLVWETLRHIPAAYREPLVMFYRQDASIREIADALGLTEACVKQRISRGRTMLKGEIANRFESFLTHIRPGEHFTVAVLAAIPILATGKQAMAASAAGIVAAQTSASGGGGHPLIAGITTSCWTFVCGIVPFFTVFIGTILGVWSGVRHAPTRRARLLMLKTALEYYAFCSCYMLINCIVSRFLSKLISSSPTFRYLFGYWSLFFIFLLPVLVVLNSIRINRQWRQCVEFDCGISDTPPASTTRKYIISLLVTALGANFVYCGIRVGFFEFVYFSVRIGSFDVSPSAINSIIAAECLFLLLLPIALIIFLLCGWRISRDDTAFEKKPPRLRNLLPILTGEQPWPKGFRNRITFWGDLTTMGLGIFYCQFLFLEWFLRSVDMSRIGLQVGNSHSILAGFSLAAYLGYAIFFAGIPRRRYWGMMILVGTVFVCNAFFICYTGLWLYPLYGDPVQFATVFGTNTWYLLWFALSGAAGLYVFRRKS